jgi:uncharacterized membrane protein YvbJ
MTVCRFCGGEVKDTDKICLKCGYNSQTDTIIPNFIGQEKKEEIVKKKSLVSSGVKNFAFWGIVVMVLLLIFKYQAKLVDAIYQVKSSIISDKNKVGKSAKTKPSSGKGNQIKVTGLLGVRSFKAPVDKSEHKEKKLEGIFYDPKNKSYVVINGQLVSEGESLGNILIKTINRDSVEVVEDGDLKTLR